MYVCMYVHIPMSISKNYSLSHEFMMIPICVTLVNILNGIVYLRYGTQSPVFKTSTLTNKVTVSKISQSLYVYVG
jgi:hypothetical protein